MLWRSLCLVILRGRPDQNVIDNFRRIYSQTVYHLIPMLCRSCGSFSLHVDRCPFCRWRAEARPVHALTPSLKSAEIRAFIVCYLCGSFQSIWYAQRTVQLCRILVPLGIWGESSALYNFWRTPASPGVDPLRSLSERKTILEHMLTFILPRKRVKRHEF